MAELHPYPFDALIRRMFRELDATGSIFDLPAKKFFTGDARVNLAVDFHGRAASSPLGPAAGPQTQMAQNIVLSWLGGCRIFELKTVQIMDELDIPRPCIDMQTIGYNVEWSQELKLQQSLEEYVKASMLLEILVASDVVPLAPGFERAIFDMSVGYDLAGIRSPEVNAFIDGMRDCSALVERFRAEIPDEWARYRALPFRTDLSDTLTLSTFHGCPPDEIERIIDYLLRDKGLNCIVKLNPTLLGPTDLRALLNDTLGYEEVVVPDSAFENDTKWHQVEGFVERLGATADELGLGFGVKFTNTLICKNHRGFFPEKEQEMYLSGAPLHVLAMTLVGRFRARFRDRFPISFSAGIDRKNFPDAVALGLTPITVCSDLLKPGGYARAQSYFKDLIGRMSKVGADDVATWILKAYGHGEAALASLHPAPAAKARMLAALSSGGDVRAAAGDDATFGAWVSRAKLLNTETYVARLHVDPRYTKAKNAKPPRKLGSMLELFDCVSCDKCIPVCPNDANFALPMAPMEIPSLHARRGDGGGWVVEDKGPVRLEMKHQIANFADFCNECGNCDIFCPEDGGPYILKPRFFGTLEQWREYTGHDGFFLAREGAARRVWARFDGRDFEVTLEGRTTAFRGDGFDVRFDGDDVAATLTGEGAGVADLTYAFIVRALVVAVYSDEQINYVSAL